MRNFKIGDIYKWYSYEDEEYLYYVVIGMRYEADEVVLEVIEITGDNIKMRKCDEWYPYNDDEEFEDVN